MDSFQNVNSRATVHSGTPNSSTFKDFLTKIQGLLRTLFLCEDFKGLENLEKKFKDFQEPARALHYYDLHCYFNAAEVNRLWNNRNMNN